MKFQNGLIQDLWVRPLYFLAFQIMMHAEKKNSVIATASYPGLEFKVHS